MRVVPPERINIIIGTAGHIDHGKTALTGMLTGCDTDRLPEEKARGMSIDIGFAPWRLPGNRVVGIVDVPGHERFIRNMVAGVSAIDLVCLVVAADDGVMPQTIEHLRILDLLGIKRGLVALTKIDLVDIETRELAALDIAELVAGTFLDGAPIVPVSSVTAEGLDVFAEMLADLVLSIPPRATGGVFRMPVERSFSAPGRGTVITGIPISGSVRLGDSVELLPEGATSRIREIQVYKMDAEEARVGECAALNTPEIGPDEVHRGLVLAQPGCLKAWRRVAARLQLLDSVRRDLRHAEDVRVHTGTAEVAGRVMLLEGNRVAAGGSAMAQIELADPVVVDRGDRFVLRAFSPATTIGGGVVVDLLEERIRRSRPQAVETVRAMEQAIGDPVALVGEALRRHGLRGATIADLVTETAVTRERVAEVLTEMEGSGQARRIGGAQSVVHLDAFAPLAEQALAALDEFHAQHPLRLGMRPAEFREALKIDANSAEALLAVMRQGGLTVEESGIARAGRQVTISADDGERLAALCRRHREAGLTPPEAEELATEMGTPAGRVTELVDHLVDRGDLVRLSDRMAFHPEAVDAAKEAVRRAIRERGPLDTAALRDVLGASRKYVVPLLDHLDQIGVTRRTGSVRYLLDA